MSVEFDPKEEHCFNVYWKIKNFSYGLEEITTSEFTLSGFPWCLTLRPKEIECRLLVLDPDYRHQWMTFLVSILPCDGSSPIHARKGECLKVSKDVIFGTRRNAFLPNDTVTFRFRYPTMSERGNLFVQSRIGVKCQSFVWTLNNFNKEKRDKKGMMKCIEKSELYGDIELRLKSTGGFNTEEQFYIEISRTGDKRCYCILKVSVLDVNGESLNDVSDEFVFEKKDIQEVKVSSSIIKKSKLLASQNLLLPNDTLSLKCNVTISLGTVTDQTSVISYCKDVAPLLQDTNDLSMSFKEPSCTISLVNLPADMLSMLHDETLSDANLQIGTEVIQVHKNILSARSPVFKAMFSKDIKETINNTVVIDDLDVETVRSLVLYIYTDTILDQQWENIKKLYFAADNYEVLSLKKKCSSLLGANLSVSNVCSVLNFADLYEDADLKTAVLNFISEHYFEVFASVEWKEFEERHPPSAIKTLRDICVRGRPIK